MNLLLSLAAVTAVSIPGPQGALEGTLVDAGAKAPVVVIIPGSGPTDRDGNNPLGVQAAPYRLLAEALAERGVSSLRSDKRGMFASKAAIADPNKVTIADYAADAHGWAQLARERTGSRCTWLLGHSEGGIVALAAAQRPDGICGVILLAAPGRKLGDVLREQLRSNPANAPVLDQALEAIDSLESGKTVDTTRLHPGLLPLFGPQVQPFLMDLMRQDPPAMAANLSVPLAIVHGSEDLQVKMADAEAIAQGQPKATLTVFDGMNHVLKEVPAADRVANMAAYADPSLPLMPGLADAIAEVVRQH